MPLRIEQISGGALTVRRGALSPALYRARAPGPDRKRVGISENNRRAKFYRLTTAGRRRFGKEKASRKRLADAMALSLTASPQEI